VFPRVSDPYCSSFKLHAAGKVGRR
jgi:hypothetical protein